DIFVIIPGTGGAAGDGGGGINHRPPGGAEIITDFVSGTDKINVSAVGGGLAYTANGVMIDNDINLSVAALTGLTGANATFFTDGVDGWLAFTNGTLDGTLIMLAGVHTAPSASDFSGATVVAIDGGKPIENATVIIQGDRILEVGPSASVSLPAGAKVVPMTGKWLIPGLMNMHVHFGLKLPGAAGAELLDEKDGEEALRMADNARRSLLAGVTTVRLTAEDHGIDFMLKRAIARGQAVGPRIESAGELIVPTGGHGSLEAD
ncbi:MAG: amidohydrolase family protein, partial [Rhodospirillaceae bacterium]|nr:amidohydrolase family protein [Rhodospirillaceae bacterium]